MSHDLTNPSTAEAIRVTQLFAGTRVGPERADDAGTQVFPDSWPATMLAPIG